MFRSICIVFASSVFVTGCATTTDVKSAEAENARDQKCYVTGSNMAKSRNCNKVEGVQAVSGEAFEQIRSTVTAPPRNSP